MRTIMYRDAIREGLDEEMARDENVVILGEDVGVNDGTFKCTAGLREKYGDLRCKDTPISESGFIGMSVGMAIAGMRPVPELMFNDFALVCMDQICNQAAKIIYMSGGQTKLPMVIRTTMGAGRSSAAQHSQNLHAFFAHIPGLKVVMPSNAADAKGLLKTAIRDNSPVIFIEHKLQYTQNFEVPEGEYLIPFGQANVVREGTDLTIVATSTMVNHAVKAAEAYAKEGKSIEVIDPRTIVPLDMDTILKSVRKTGKLLIIDEGHESFGISGEIALRVQKDAFYDLEAPIMRLGLADVPLPFSPALEFPLIPDLKSIKAAVKEILG
ncbi:Pyruvate dehydrogenase E1 component subunit beta [uncultured Roseburia sp.]|uniref:Alpha-ketoacid dehydrogenase subunit beta n=1 Tax=Brotonthovivens ammoniilytica TaxID=2981725 RepID=A0ABT2THM1_9FIRM|nr:alpha-ketoacid dehydrogenase subunit beta [Brotonthovivens ammoniilytica]MCU6761069.1 alpha-ketoacid dehydrogenase subunit beta [Brotonthovivens ammoniilytica]SCI17980.1 Pyruvate dehydrogenase E1 component subunit beta [uncultured Roseburia sp.]